MNQLSHLQEFETLLTDYRPSAAALKTLQKTKLVLLVAPTGGGRNTIIDELQKTGQYHYIVSDTTRQPRVNNGVLEVNGREYWFRSEADMLADIKAGKFLEAEVIHRQQVSGISIRELKNAYEQQKISINEVDLGGISNVVKAKPDTMAILVLPPTFDEWLKRLEGRGTMPADERKRRFETAAKIFAAGLEDENLKLVINDQLEEAVAAIHRYATRGEFDNAQSAKAHEISRQLLFDTQMHLAKLS